MLRVASPAIVQPYELVNSSVLLNISRGQGLALTKPRANAFSYQIQESDARMTLSWDRQVPGRKLHEPTSAALDRLITYPDSS